MKVWHLTFKAADIIADGFIDGAGAYLTNNEYHGVWVKAFESFWCQHQFLTPLVRRCLKIVIAEILPIK